MIGRANVCFQFEDHDSKSSNGLNQQRLDESQDILYSSPFSFPPSSWFFSLRAVFAPQGPSASTWHTLQLQKCFWFTKCFYITSFNRFRNPLTLYIIISIVTRKIVSWGRLRVCTRSSSQCMKSLDSTIVVFHPFHGPLPHPPNSFHNPKPLQPCKKCDSLDPLHVPHFLLFPCRCSRSLSADPFRKAYFNMWAREGGKEKRNCTEAAPDLEKPRFPWSQHDAAAQRHSSNFRSPAQNPNLGPVFPVTLTWHWQGPDNPGVNGGRHLLPESPTADAPPDYGYEAGSKANFHACLRRRCPGRKGAGQRCVGVWQRRDLGRERETEGREREETGKRGNKKKRILRSEPQITAWTVKIISLPWIPKFRVNQWLTQGHTNWQNPHSAVLTLGSLFPEHVRWRCPGETGGRWRRGLWTPGVL